MKKCILALSVFFFATALHAQSASDWDDDDHFLISFTLGPSFPMGSFKTTNKTGFSGRMNVDINLAHKLRLVVVSGSSDFNGKSHSTPYGYSEDYDSYAFVPVNCGLKYFYAGHLFVEGQAGALFSVSHAVKGVGINFAPSVGYELGYLDISVRYDSYHIKSLNLSALTASISYGF